MLMLEPVCYLSKARHKNASWSYIYIYIYTDPKPSVEYLLQHFVIVCNCLKLWNTLPVDIKHRPSVETFKKSLKTFLIK